MSDEQIRDKSYRKFVLDWQSSDSVAEVAEKFGISKNGVQDIAMKLRKSGVKLKTMRKDPVRGEIDAEDLNKLIDEAAVS